MQTGDASELTDIRAAANIYDLFLYMKPSVTILDRQAFDEATQSGPAWLFARPSCYLAIYESASLIQALQDAPLAPSKVDSIEWESRLHDRLSYPTLWPEVWDGTAKRIDIIDGQPELIIGNHIVEKAKGTAHCGREQNAPIPGLCDHILAMFNVAC